MRKILQNLYLIVILLLISQFASSQFSVDGHIRTRGEYRDGYRTLAVEDTHGLPLVLQRSRLMMSYKEDNLTFKLTGQDARVWGESEAASPKNTFGIYEAWVKWLFHPNIGVKVGRQEISYDDQRLLSIRNFGVAGATYDALLMYYEDDETKTSVHVGGMINNDRQSQILDYYTGNLFKYMAFAWGSFSINDFVSLNAINIFDLKQKPSEPEIMYGRNTLGANAIVTKKGVAGGRMGGYYQFGNSWFGIWPLENQKQQISAYSINASAWADLIEKVKVTLSFDLYSGNDWSKSSGKFTSFNRLLASRHGHLGYMDYFTDMQMGEVAWTGIVDMYLRVDYTFSQKADIQARINNFSMEKPYLPPDVGQGFEKVGKRLGNEISILLNYKPAKNIAIQTAWMLMLPTETLKRLQGDNTRLSHFGYISLLFTPNFFTYSKPETQP